MRLRNHLANRPNESEPLLKASALEKKLAEAEEWISALRRDCKLVCYMANQGADEGVQGRAYDKSGSKGSDTADPVGNRAMRSGFDNASSAADSLKRSLDAAVTELKRAGKAAWSLLPLPEDEAQALAERDEVTEGTIQGQCANRNCGRLVARTAKDRLRSGRCENCYRWLKSHGDERPRHLCALEDDAAAELALDMERVISEDVA